ncbi:hypothetical protein HYV79_04975 [Candidatus Woesearchaeota archaeon]|nr:hypothetical protein [Candidatus Woesearchaeota archaeon]
MIEEKSSSSSSSEVSVLNLFLGVASLGAGAYHGYCDAQGIPFEKENMEWVLTYGPAVVRGAAGAEISAGLSGVLVVAGASAGICGTVGAVKGGIQTLIGYGIGYVTGYVTK